MAISKKDKIKRFIPSLYKPNTNPNIKALLEAIGGENDKIVEQILNAKEQLFVNTAVGEYLDALGSNYGVERPLTTTSFQIENELFRDIIKILSFQPKQIKQTMENLLFSFFGNDPDVFIEEINPNEIVIQLPATLVSARDTLLGTTHIKNYSGEVLYVDNTTKEILMSIDSEKRVLFEHRIDQNSLNGYIPWNEFGSGTSALSIAKTRSTFDGLSSIQYDKLNGANQSGIQKLFTYPIDITNLKEITFLTYIPDMTDFTGVSVLFYSDNNINGIGHNISGQLLSVGWNKITFDLDQAPSNTFGTGLDVANLSQIVFRHTFNTTTTVQSGWRFGQILVSEENSAVTTDIFAGATFSQGLVEHEIINSTELGCFTLGPSFSDGCGYKLSFNPGTDLSDVQVGQRFYMIQDDYPGDYLFNPSESTFLAQKDRAILNQTITNGDTGVVVQFLDATNIPDEEGYLVFNYGKDNEEELVPYLERNTSTSVIIDPSYVFLQDHSIGDIINVATLGGFEPEDDGLDHAFYVVGTEEPVIIVQSILDKIKASGTVLRFIVKF